MTIRKIIAALACALFLAMAGCSKRPADQTVVVEIPPGFSGNFLLEMGTKDALPLSRQGDAYLVTVSRDGKVATSTFIEKPKVTFKNASNGSIWGYSQSVYTTGDGIVVGGRIEFFVGTQKEYEAEQGKKNHSGKSPLAIDQGISEV